MSGFSNRAEDIPALTGATLRARIDETFQAYEKMSPMRAWGADQKVPVPEGVFRMLEGALEEAEYADFERDLAAHLEGLG